MLAILVVVYVVRLVDPATIVDSARSADTMWMLFAAVLLPLNLYLEALIWRPFLPRAYANASTKDLMLAVLSGYPLGIITPGRVGEFAGRALLLPPGDRTALAASVAAARVPELASLFGVGSVVLTFVVIYRHVEFQGVYLLIGLTTILAIVAFVFSLMPAQIAQLLRRVLSLRKAWASKLEFIESVDRRGATRAIFLSTLRLLIYSTQFAVLVMAFADTISPVVAWEGSVLTLLAKTVIPPITLLDLGIREGAAVFFFTRMGVAGSAAFNAAFMLFLINLVVPTVAGLPLVSRYRLSTRTQEAHQAVPRLNQGGQRS